jgi:uncharacterized protein (TIRG00374 family)
VRKNAQLIIGLVVSLLALALAFRGANLGEMASALRKANYFALVLGIGLIWLGLYCRALSWRVILGGKVPYWRVFAAMNEGYLLNYLLPFRLGEFGRAYLISRRNNLTAMQALSSVVVERVVDLVMDVLLLLIFLPFVAGLDWARGAALTSIALGVVAVAGLVVVARNRDWILRWGMATLRRPRWHWLHPERWEERLEAFLSGLAVLQDPRKAIQAATWSGLAWVSAGVATWLMLRAFLPSATVTMGFVTLTVVGLLAAVPSAPGSAGVFEFAVVQILAVFSVERNLALSFALVFHASQFALVTVLGSLALAGEGETLSHLIHSAQALLSNSSRLRTAPAAAPGAPTQSTEPVAPDR